MKLLKRAVNRKMEKIEHMFQPKSDVCKIASSVWFHLQSVLDVRSGRWSRSWDIIVFWPSSGNRMCFESIFKSLPQKMWTVHHQNISHPHNCTKVLKRTWFALQFQMSLAQIQVSFAPQFNGTNTLHCRNFVNYSNKTCCDTSAWIEYNVYLFIISRECTI